jgi:hypothetical protein
LWCRLSFSFNFFQETLSHIEHKINHVIGLKHTLELVEPLHAVLHSGVESRLFMEIRHLLQDNAYADMLEKVRMVISSDAKALKVLEVAMSFGQLAVLSIAVLSSIQQMLLLYYIQAYIVAEERECL